MNRLFKYGDQYQGHKISIFEIEEKHGCSANLSLFRFSFAKYGKKINNFVIEGNVSTIYRKTKMDQEFKSE